MSTNQDALRLLIKLRTGGQVKQARLLLLSFSALSPNRIACVCVCVCVCVSVCVHNSSLIISKNSENTEKCKELHQLETSMVGLIEHVPHDSLYYILMGDDRMHIFL